MQNVLFVCNGNSCRSQMAEGFANALRSDTFCAASAGLNPHAINPYAMKVMLEAGVDISSHTSTNILATTEQKFDTVYVLCCEAQSAVDELFANSGSPVVCVNICSPKKAVAAAAREKMSEEERLMYYRSVRDEIRAWVLSI